MSEISSTHSIVAFVPGKVAPYSDQRLAKIVFKYTSAMEKAGMKKQESKCVSIPPLAALTSEQVTKLNPYIVAMCENAQDQIIRGLVEEGRTSVHDDQIGFDQVLAQLAAEAAGERLNREAVIAWFDGGIAEMLSAAFAEKLGCSTVLTQGEEEQIGKQIAMYRESVAMLAGGKTRFAPEKAQKIKQAIQLSAPAGDKLAEKFVSRLDAMIKAPDELLAL